VYICFVAKTLVVLFRLRTLHYGGIASIWIINRSIKLLGVMLRLMGLIQRTYSYSYAGLSS